VSTRKGRNEAKERSPLVNERNPGTLKSRTFQLRGASKERNVVTVIENSKPDAVGVSAVIFRPIRSF
jgi:hypothetical protein